MKTQISYCKLFALCAIVLTIVSCNENPQGDDKENLQSLTADSNSIANSFFLKQSILPLLRQTPVEIGCLLQKEFNYRDSIFNCDYKNYVNNGDPCKNAEEYYEGISIPVFLVKRLHPQIKEINLDFEHGNLRVINITFEDSMLISSLTESFKLPNSKSEFPENITDIDFGESIFSNEKPINPNYTKWLVITGFDHIGAGEVNCK